jgi:hypothetical protein
MSQSSRKSQVRLGATSPAFGAAFVASLLGAGALSLHAPALRAQGATLRYDVVAPSRGTGLEAPLVLRIPASARLLGMANVGVASNDGDAIFYNPGMLTQARGVAVSAQRYGSRASAGAVGSVQALGSWSVGVGAQVLQYATDPVDPVTAAKQGAARLSDGGSASASSTAIAFGAGRVVKGLRIGAAVKYAEERLGAVRDGVFALDVGVHRPLGPGILALSVQNLGAGPDLSGVSGPLPTRLQVGYGGGFIPIGERWDLGMQTQVSVERDGFVRPAGGVELGYVPIDGVAVVLRSGLRLPREKDEPLATAGLGVTVDRYSLDYAMEPMRGGRPVSHRFGFRIK